MVAAAVSTAVYTFYASGMKLDALVFGSAQDIWLILALAAAFVGTADLITTKPYPLETIYCAVIVTLAAFSLQVVNIILGCASLISMAVLVLFGSAHPSKPGWR